MEDIVAKYKLKRISYGSVRSNCGDYRHVKIDNDHVLHLEELVKASEYNLHIQPYYYLSDKNPPYNAQIAGSLNEIWLRKTVVEKLVRINSKLKSCGLELCIWDGYRPVATQRGIWNFFFKKFSREMEASSSEQIRAKVLNYVSDPNYFDESDSSTWPVHTSGGAVDLTILDCEKKTLLEMGAHFDQMDEVARSDFFERELEAGHIAESNCALLNRRLLHAIMLEEEFVNYPMEYWHFDWGDQLYIANALDERKDPLKKAWYGYCKLPLC